MGPFMNMEQTKYGYEIRTPHLIIFFGNAEANIQNLSAAYPSFQFKRLKQIHSDAVVKTSFNSEDLQVIADAHFTSDKNVALPVITADCVPVFIYHHRQGIIAGIHAGWRGVANKIIGKTIREMKALGAPAHELDVVIGPHIQKPSFEVGNDVRDLILTSLGPLSANERASYFSAAQDQGKSFVDLNMVVRTQLQKEGIESEHLFDLHIDTFSNKEFHSHRRDKEKAGRQISFICRTS